ncbi:MAG: adenine methyltransferase [Comamonadaceae bacterium]|nr:adenine methyltransferase [Comamonadaceae bacterium]
MARRWLGLPNPHGQSNAQVVKPWRNGQDLSKRPSDTWIVDFGVAMSEGDAALFEAPFDHVLQHVKAERLKVRRERTARLWWLHEEARVSMRKALLNVHRYIATPRVSKFRFFVWLDICVLADTRLNVITRADDTTFGILSSRIHEVWSLAQASMHGVGNDPTYNAKSCFETFPFPTGLTPADTAHQHTETLPDGTLIPAHLSEQNTPLAHVKYAQAATNNVASQIPSRSDPEQNPLPPKRPEHTPPKNTVRNNAIAIATAAKKLNDLRETWLNPPEWTHKVPEVTPLGMTRSPYPDRIEPKPGLSEPDLKALQKRTLTNLYNARPAWLTLAHQQLDAAVAAAYGWTDYSAALPDDEILKRLLALNLAATSR